MPKPVAIRTYRPLEVGPKRLRWSLEYSSKQERHEEQEDEEEKQADQVTKAELRTLA